MFYKKFIGQSGKRVVTLHVAPNELPAPSAREVDEILIMATKPTISATQSASDRSLQVAPPLTLQVRCLATEHECNSWRPHTPLHVVRMSLFLLIIVHLNLVRHRGELRGSSTWSETAAVSWTCSKASCAQR